MSRFPGHIIKLPANTPSQSSAPGVWTLKDQLVAQRNNQWPFQRDPDFRYTTLLLQGNVPNTTGPQAMNLPLAYNSDASSNNFLITPNGDVSPRPFSPYMGSNYSNGFDGAADFLGIANNALVQLTNATAFTIEAWVYPISIANNPQIVFAYNPSSPYQGYSLRILTSSGLFEMFDGTSWISFGAAQLNTWQHIAVSYEGNGTTRRFFINGVQQGPAITVPSTINWTSGGVNISSSGESFNGYISNLRIVKGTAIYTSNFTPPSQPLTAITNTSLLTCQSNRFIDNSGNNLTITRNGDVRVTDNSPFVSADFTTGSGYFDNSDWLSLDNNAALQLGTSDFTIESWAYLVKKPTTDNHIVISKQNYYLYYQEFSSKWTFETNLGSILSSSTWPMSEWQHVAVTRSGNTFTLWVNGQSQGTLNNSGSVTDAGGLVNIGRNIANSANHVLGYISDFRFVKGVAVYTGAFAPPTRGLLGNSGASSAAAYPSTTNVNTTFAASATSLLTLQTRAPSQNHGFIDSSPNEFIVTRNGNVSQGTFSPFSPTGWGNYLNSTSGNYLSVPASNAFDVGTNNFTAELWFYINPGATSYNGWGRAHILGGAEATSSSRIAIVVNGNSLGSSGLTWSVGSTSGSYATAIAQGVWHHVALVRSGTTITLYLNGTAVSTGNSSASIANNIQHIGAFRATDDQFSDYFYGYVSNVRFIKNQALFSGSTVGTTYFTPSTAPLTTTSVGSNGAGAAASITGTVSLLTCQSNRFLDQTGKTLTVVGSPSVQAFSPFAPANSVSPLVTGGSGYFPSSATLTIPSAPALNLVGDFCMEGWAYPTAAGFTFAWKYTGGNVGASEYWWVIDGTNQLSIALDGGGGEDYFRTAANTITLNAWNHCVLTRVGNEVRQFINGVLQSYNTTSRTLNATSTTFQTNGTLGYTSGFRIMKGSIPDAYRTTATTTGTTVFTPPTAPPVATQNTSLLLNFTGGGIVDATGKNVIETVGNAHVTAAQAKWDFQRGGAAPQFDGGTDCLFEASSPNYGFGTGDFTIEFWLRLNNTGTQTLVSNLTTASSVAPHLYYQLNSNIRYFTNGADRITGSALNANQWYHIAVCRSNGNTRLFVDGSQVGATYPDTNNYGTSNPLGVGDYGVPLNGASTLNGYISNLRVTKSARYTVNFNTNLPNGPFPIG